MTSTIAIEPLKGVTVKYIQVGMPDGKVKELAISEINGVLLMPVSMLTKYFHESRSTIQVHFDTGRLIRYHSNGAVKQDRSPSKVFIDFNAWLQLYASQARKIIRPKKFVIRVPKRAGV